MTEKGLNEQRVAAVLEAVSAERREELRLVGQHAAHVVTRLAREARAGGDVEKLREPWVLLDRVRIPRRHVSDEAEEHLRAGFFALAGAPENVFDCERCRYVTRLTVLTLVGASVVISAATSPEVAAAVHAALIAEGFVVAESVYTLALLFIGVLASDVADVTCRTVQAC